VLANSIDEGIARQVRHFFSRCVQELAAQSTLLLFVPAYRFQQIGVHLRAD
jgi:hypothetical protein